MENSSTHAEGYGYTHEDDNDRLVVFKMALNELQDTPAELARRLYRLGDHRSPKVIVRGIQRMLAGETGVSGEMLVIAKLLVRERRRLLHQYGDLKWELSGKESLTAVAGDFRVNLHPETRGRWKIDVVHLKTGYNSPWQEWQDSLAAAKRKALVCVEDAYNEMHEIELDRQSDAA